MAEEYLDIVDENGNLTGEKELRSVCHEKGLWHQVAVVYFYRFKENGLELLVHLRSKFKEQSPNKWAIRFGGHVEAGASVEETLIKEIQEEAGVDLVIDSLAIGTKSFYDSEFNKEVGNIYYYNFSGEKEDLTFNDGEVQEAKWMNINEIENSIKNNPDIWASPSMEGFLARKNDLLNKISK